MYLQNRINLISLLFIAALTGCSSTTDWPNLSDKMPDPLTRARVIERVDPTIVPREPDKAPTSLAEAETLLASVTEDVIAAQEIYASALDTFKKGGPTQNDKVHLWLEAQLALTRLSQTVSRFDVILFDEQLAKSELGLRVKEQKQRTDSLIVTERQALAAIKPAEIS